MFHYITAATHLWNPAVTCQLKLAPALSLLNISVGYIEIRNTQNAHWD